MPSPFRILFIAGAGAVMAACATDNATSPVASSQAAAALISAPLSFGATNSSFVGNSAPTNAFVPTGLSAGESHDDHGGPGWGGFMGGGIGEAFIGGLGFGPGIGRGPFENFGRREAGDSDSEESDSFDHSDNCAFSATTNRVECATITHDGLTINRSFSFLDASGAVQQAFNRTTTNTVNVTTSTSGTLTHHETGHEHCECRRVISPLLASPLEAHNARWLASQPEPSRRRASRIALPSRRCGRLGTQSLASSFRSRTAGRHSRPPAQSFAP